MHGEGKEIAPASLLLAGSLLPASWELATHYLGLTTKPAMAEGRNLAELPLIIYWHGPAFSHEDFPGWGGGFGERWT